MNERLTKAYGYRDGYHHLPQFDHEVVHDKLGVVEDILFDESGVEVLTIDRLREIAAAERDGRLVVRPSCNECIHESVHYSKEPCYSCYGQDAIGEKGFYFEPRAEAALAGRERVMNADDIVRALREKYDETDVVHFFDRTIFREAAYLIESLQAQLAEYTSTGLTPGDVKDLQGLCKENGLSEYVDLIVEAKRQMSKDNERCIEQDERIEQLEAQLAASKRKERDARNELCLKCGRYHEAHNGACDGCRWKEIQDEI
jgi:hypothetical protein